MSYDVINLFSILLLLQTAQNNFLPYIIYLFFGGLPRHSHNLLDNIKKTYYNTIKLLLSNRVSYSHSDQQEHEVTHFLLGSEKMLIVIIQKNLHYWNFNFKMILTLEYISITTQSKHQNNHLRAVQPQLKYRLLTVIYLPPTSKHPVWSRKLVQRSYHWPTSGCIRATSPLKHREPHTSRHPTMNILWHGWNLICCRSLFIKNSSGWT